MTPFLNEHDDWIDGLAVESVAASQWPNSSLGCPRPGVNYLQVITSGYQFTLQAQGKQYEYHTDQGKRAVRCDQ